MDSTAHMPLISVVQQAELAYPDASPDFSPSEAYPEYRFTSLAAESNTVYAAARRLLADARLDAARFGSPDWNPFGGLVRPGSRVFVLCNFVYHPRITEDRRTFLSKVTHPSVIRAVIDYLLIAVGERGLVRVGNAPVQGADWSRLMRETGVDRLLAFYRQHSAPVELHDLRAFVAERDLLGNVTRVERRDTDAISVSVDLGQDSLLVPLDTPHRPFRVSEYDPQRTAAAHQQDQHQYVINRHILDSDVIFAVPKLKTHQKVGITCGLKGSVGAIAHKDCLAHHRFGPPEQGGDEYPRDRSGLLRLQSRFHDRVWHTDPESRGGRALRIVDRALQRLTRRVGLIQGGSWYGNDTAWRMALDITRVITHADSAGRLHDQPQRAYYALIDGVIGGEGNGPLAMTPVDSRVLLFSPDIVAGDYAAATLMGFDPARIPLIKDAYRLRRYPLAAAAFGEGTASFNGEPMSLADLASRVSRPFQPPPGWIGHLERQPS